MLAYDFPILGLFWTMLIFFLWIAWLIILFRTIVDIFRSDDLSGWGKAGWLIFVAIIPWLGVLVYLIARGQKMGQRELAQAQAREAAMQDYIRQAAGPSGGVADEIAKLADLQARGVITEDEFEQQKRRLLV